MELFLGIALGLSLTLAVVLGILGWDLRSLCRRQEKELWALRQALRLHRARSADRPPTRA